MNDVLNTPEVIRYTVLLVDDEVAILNSLKRLLRSQPYDVLLAENGQQALELLDKRPVDLVISDARMPTMDGATLLAEIHRRHPDTLRILLTGYTDMTMLAKAINEGRIYRYISKPWDDDELLLTLKQALSHQHSEKERVRLEQLTREQKDALVQLNLTLEKRVEARTGELQQTADMLDLAYEELKRSYVVSTEVFSLLINQRLPKGKQTNKTLIELVRACCSANLVEAYLAHDLTMAAALYNVGKLSWSDSMLSAPSDMLHSHDRDKYRSYPGTSESLLMSLEPMQDAARLIRHHQEHWDGGGFPDRLKGTAIPVGSRLLKLAVDFVELQCGLVLERSMNRDEVIMYLRKYGGRLYDPDMVEPFIQVCASYLTDITLADPSVQGLGTRDLKNGMVLARNLNADNGMLLLNAGKVMTTPLVDKLIAFEAMEGARYTVFVRTPEPAPA
ncbi:HD domain-containing phosphohydrolase [Pseudomonas turukhanskensis]|uniref:Two-component system response regulator n=1 Tax=Pseudomonas turukhanskensis TaxID=1806536 RepID=A0A9W6NE98_9PSED|nr:HD domain-containing phosphohydrolase [Pseudomonas turukhanskensis]GLK88464.1 two-component system response regulator [Pseudomonas turukhanskensis]